MVTMELTEEQKQDIAERRTQFIERYTILTEELQMDFAQYPVPVPIGNGAFGFMINAELQDKKYLTPLSPIQP